MTAVSLDTAAAQERRRRNPFTRRLPWWGEALIAVVFYWLYDFVQALTGSPAPRAIAHGHDIVNAEKHLHIWVEPQVNHWITSHHTLSLIAGYDYGLCHAIVTAIVLGFLWWRRPRLEVPMRNGLVALSLVALLVYWLYPVAPPRLTVGGLTDTLVVNNILGAKHVHEGLVNLYAAMPSLHVAWSLWCAAAIVFSFTSRWRHLAWLYPMWTTFVIVATANHYFLDAAAGAVFILVPLVIIYRSLKADPIPSSDVGLERSSNVGLERSSNVGMKDGATTASGAQPARDAVTDRASS